MSATPTTSDSYQVVWLIRRLFRAFGQKADAMLQERGITAADRAVLEFLHPDQELTVPEVARKYDVSRQHVQVTVNRLIDLDLLELAENPRHKRSSLVRMTKRGRKLFETILENDKRVIDALFADISDRDVHTTRRTLQGLLNALKEEAGNEDA